VKSKRIKYADFRRLEKGTGKQETENRKQEKVNRKQKLKSLNIKTLNKK
jgi:hypothetical protein